MAYNVLVVDDQNISRQLFEMYINGSEQYHLAGSVASAALADIYCEAYPIDLILMDVVMNDGSNGLQEAAKIKKKHPSIKIIIVTSMPEVSYIKRAKEGGVDSFWYKELSKEPILQIMDRTMAGESVYPDDQPVVQIGMASSEEFTEREIDILREIVTGASNREIADKLNMSHYTVKTHIQHMIDKTGLKNRTNLAVQARALGLIISEEEI